MKKWILSLSLVYLTILAGCTAAQAAVMQTSALTTSANSGAVMAKSAAAAELNPITDQNASVIDQVQSIYRNIYSSVNPSVVNLKVVETYSYGFRIGTISGEGAGFVWDAQGHIVTNNHVIENASSITVVFSDGTTTMAKVIGTDVQSDLAVIKVDPEGLNLRPVSLGDSLSVAVGDLVIAIGNPYGLEGSMTQGIVSALSRSLTVDDSNPFSSSYYTIPDIIQTDVAVNPGNSGGVLVNTRGEVIGVTSAIKSSTNANAGIAFAIPAHIVNRIVPELIANGRYQHPSLGLQGITLTASYALDMNLPENTHGVLVTSLTRGGPADLAGVKVTMQQFSRSGRITIVYGDVITAVDGTPIETYEDLISYIFNKAEVGQTVTLTLLRSGKEIKIPVTLAAE